jgi:hypothetical protein
MYKLLKILLLKLSRHSRRPGRDLRRDKRQKLIKATKKTLLEDIYTGYKLEEFTMLPEDKDILIAQLSHPNAEKLLKLYKKYRGYKISDHPSIYNMFATNRQTK